MILTGLDHAGPEIRPILGGDGGCFLRSSSGCFLLVAFCVLRVPYLVMLRGEGYSKVSRKERWQKASLIIPVPRKPNKIVFGRVQSFVSFRFVCSATENTFSKYAFANSTRPPAPPIQKSPIMGGGPLRDLTPNCGTSRRFQYGLTESKGAKGNPARTSPRPGRDPA